MAPGEEGHELVDETGFGKGVGTDGGGEQVQFGFGVAWRLLYLQSHFLDARAACISDILTGFFEYDITLEG